LLAAIVDSSDDAIVSKNLKSVVTSWNSGAERVFGYSADEMIGRSIDVLFPEDRWQEEAEILDQILKGNRVEHFETVRRRKDGTLIDVSLTISPIRNAHGKIVGASKIARDITAQKQAHRKLKEAHDELKRVDRMKVEFLATLSHELRTPLTAIVGWIQMLKDDPNPDDLDQGLQIIERNVRVQAQLIEDLLDMSRIETGKISLDMQRVDVATVVFAAIETIRPAAESKDIRLTSGFGSLGGAVWGDKNRLQQVVWNLLSNAVKFTPPQGRIHVSVEHANSRVEISVADSGQGIAPDFLEHVFDRFRQADSSITRRYGGLGLGLAIVKNLAELHGGSITAHSAGVGHGSTFTVSLPLLPAALEPSDGTLTSRRKKADDESYAERELTGVRVLVVDDEVDSGDIVKRILQRHGAEVRTATSMDGALAEFGEFHPHMVISDIGMPGHDGYDLIRRLRELPGGEAVPAVALTALARSEDRMTALRAGFQLHVSKPIDAAELIAIVQNLAARRMKSG
jgi:PAS domain S-box-containing protein